MIALLKVDPHATVMDFRTLRPRRARDLSSARAGRESRRAVCERRFAARRPVAVGCRISRNGYVRYVDDDKSFALPPSAADLISEVRAALEPDGWKVAATAPSEGNVYIEVDHALSSRSGFGFRDDSPTAKEGVESWLRQDEFQAVAERPAQVDHVSLIGTFRRAAAGSGWDNAVVAIVARVLRSESLLTDDEAEWLERAGTPWR
jgi:hypothetical protein